MSLHNPNEPNFQGVANNVAFSVQVALSPTSSPTDRTNATAFCNNYIQATVPVELCTVGFILTGHSDPMVVRTGLQFIEHVAKFNWQAISDRDNVKERLLLLMKNGLHGIVPGDVQSPSYIQEALAKVIVEIAKREWPQLWPNLFPRLFEIANSSDLALLVLRRMVEDVATLQTVDCAERRRELSQSLTVIAPDVIATFFRVLVDSVKKFQETGLELHKKRSKVCLGSLLPYIEWTNPASFAKDNMIPILFALLPDPVFQMEAAECILQLVERKPARKEDRFDIPKICFSDESFAQFLHSATSAQANNYDFLRKLGDILQTLASNAVVGRVKLENFLQGCENLAIRSEAIAVLSCTMAINHFLKTLDKEPPPASEANFVAEIDKYLIRLLSPILNKFVTAPPNPAEKEEICRLKSEFSTLLRNVSRRVPTLYNEVHNWLNTSLSSANAIQNFQWEALALVVDAVASSVADSDSAMIQLGLMDLEKCYSKFVSEESIELKSLILSLISALFVFLSLVLKRGEFAEAHLRLMLSIFGSVFKSFDYEESPNSRELRRHSSSLLIKLASKFPAVMAMSFEFIHSFISSSSSKLTTMEYNSVTESLMIISNVWNDYEKQSAFLRTFFIPTEWAQVSMISDSPQALTAIFPENVFFEKKSIMVRNLNVAFGVLRRVKKINKASAAVLQQTQNQNSNTSKIEINGTLAESENTVHPAYDHVCPYLPVVLKLVKSIHSLVESPQLSFVLDLSESEKSAVIGNHAGISNDIDPAHDFDKEKSHPEKIKTFILNLLEQSYGILGECCSVLAPKFYTIPQLGDAYLSFVGYNSQALNDFRLRGALRSVFKQFLTCCPPSQAARVVIPFAQKFFPFMLDRLAARWAMIENSKSTDADGEEEKEVVENSVIRLLTKEYIELLNRLIENPQTTTSGLNLNSTTSSQGSGGGIGTGIGDVDMDSCQTDGHAPRSQSPTGTSEIGDMGMLLLGDPMCFTSIVNCVVAGLCWDDSIVCLRASRCILMIWDKIATQQEVVKGTFATALRAVCLWVENEANMDSLLKIVDACFRTFYDLDPQFIQMIKEWGAPEPEIQKLVMLCQGPRNEKKRKDLLRKLVNSNPSLEKNKSPKSQWLRGLPQLKLDGKDKAGKNLSDVDLTECFSLIHK